ncbi:MAG: S8 family peptidase [Bacteroidetes bacterium]|nr:S8 family peptidase [Bacteroidota bacterium]
MKQLNILLLFFLFLSFNVQAQNNEKPRRIPADFPSAKIARPTDAMSTHGMSTNTAFLLLEMMEMKKKSGSINEEQLTQKYALIRKGNKLYANSFIKLKGQLTMSGLSEQGVLLGSKIGSLYTALVPIDKIEAIVQMPDLLLLDIGSKEFLHMDTARIVTNVDKVHKGLAPLTMPYTGKGVVVGDLDVGFDLTHPNFYDTTGTANYRVKRFWNQKNNSGTPPVGYAYGSEYTTEAAMLSAPNDDTVQSHGSHTAGTAAGAGGYPGSPYKGVAYESDIVLVAAKLSTTYIIDAIKYVQNYAASVGKPCVINMSFGSQEGAHDGTSTEEQAMDSLTGPGMLLVRSAGNSGSNNMYAEHTFVNLDSVAYTFFTTYPKLTAGYRAYMYGRKNENFKVQLLLMDIITLNPSYFTATIAANIDSVYSFNLIGNNNDTMKIGLQASIDANSGKPNINIAVLDNAIPNTSTLKLFIKIIAPNSFVQMWADRPSPGVPYGLFTDFGIPDPHLITGNSTHTVGVGAGGKNVISVGAYTTHTIWTSLNAGLQMQEPGFMAPSGAIAPFSSQGPTADGRTKPDITAPGNMIISSVNSYDKSGDYDANSPFVVKDVSIGSKKWYFGKMQGTSMSCPMVTGILALWLQKYPTLTPAQALDRMKKTAITDNYTGAIPVNGSNTWGWGKINAFDGMTVSVEKAAIKNTLKVYPNPTSNELHIAFDKQANNTVITIADITGKIVYSNNAGNLTAGSEQVVNMENSPAGIYILRIVSNGEEAVYKIAKQ